MFILHHAAGQSAVGLSSTGSRRIEIRWLQEVSTPLSTTERLRRGFVRRRRGAAS